MSGYGMVPNAFACAAYIEALCTHDCSTSGYQLLQAWRAERFPIDAYAYSVVIRGFCDEMKIDEAESVFLNMENYGVVPDAQTYSVLIDGYCKKLYLQKALSLHSLMLSKGKLEEAIGLLEEMTSRQIQMDVIHYTTMIKGLFARGKIHEAMMMFENLKKNGVEPDSITYNVLVAGLSRNGLVSKVQELLNYMEEHGLREDPKMPNLVIENLCIGGKVKEATEFFNSLEVKTVDNYAAMINGYCAANATKSAYKLFVNLSKEGVFIKSSLVRLVSRLCMENSSFRAIEDTITPDVVYYTVLIDGYCKMNNLNAAFVLFEEMVDQGIEADAVTYTALLSGCCRNGDKEKAQTLCSEMTSKGILPPENFSYLLQHDTLATKKI
ncbi:pentatricopeptide repeat-containing protein [Cucumis melo var. makuwa]|uniref:Pentatricopeptide repeat-containing protein n=1 Tax=Cucumis melo var. makuwa TaxID=1194695 RepID=A0A5A7UFN7_CUCMM|nr:pentatricopeptide repeat-containing protein [Cucumis melo var. makuwa]